jgi:alpha-glucosidase (family GH31 glycosyl hydrolase)
MTWTAKTFQRREALKLLSAAAVGTCLEPRLIFAQSNLRIAGRVVQISVTTISANTVRLQITEQLSKAMPDDGAVVLNSSPVAGQRIRPKSSETGLRVQIAHEPLTFHVTAPDGRRVQQLRIDENTGSLSFALGDGPVLGMGEGGPQYDRRGNVDHMRSGQGGYRLRTHGGRVPIQWLIGVSGWAMFIHQPLGSFDLTGNEGQFSTNDSAAPLPLDIFVVDAKEPAIAMAEYARITGHPEMPPLWALGYQQSHRTLANREEILSIARTFREKKLPCDALIYLGTGFCPSGWNTENGSFQFNPRVFSDPKEIIDQFHAIIFAWRCTW